MSEAPERIWINKVHGQHPEDWDFTDGKHLTKRQFSDKVEYVRADRIEELEAKLAKAENGLFTLSHIHDGNPSDARADILPLDYARHMLWEARSIARTTLAELTGETDE